MGDIFASRAYFFPPLNHCAARASADWDRLYYNTLGMTEWFYARGGQQNGPISFEQLKALSENGGLNQKDLVWNSSMKDWLPAGQVPGIFSSASATNPFAPPTSAWGEGASVSSVSNFQEITPGSEPIKIMDCIRRGFSLTCRHFGKILLVALVYILCTVAANIGLGAMDGIMGWSKKPVVVAVSADSTPEQQVAAAMANFQIQSSPLNLILSQVLSLFLSIGLTRIGLGLISGKEFSVGQLFSGGKKLLPMLVATLLYWIAVGIGLLLFVVPGVYLIIRLSNYIPAIVDRDLGPLDALKYSWSLSTNNAGKLFGLILMYFLIGIAGMLALCIGIFFALPVIWLSSLVAYRWLQYGQQSTLDHPGTETPLLTDL